MHEFAYGWITPVLAYGLSLVGSLLGLTATVRARAAAGTGLRARWLVLAAFAIGGTGIWTMHFLAMIGFSVDGTAVRYDVATTVASWLTAVIVVGVGLFIVGFGKPSVLKVLVAGVLTGAGVAAMHYSGMAAMRVDGSIGYDTPYVVAAVAIAIVASTVALWFTVTVQRPPALFGSAALMAAAISGMHYTGMYGMRVHVHSSVDGSALTGVDAMTFLIPILVLVLGVVVALFYALLAVPSQADRDVQAELRARIDGSHPATQPSYTEAYLGPVNFPAEQTPRGSWDSAFGHRSAESAFGQRPTSPAPDAPVSGRPGRTESSGQWPQVPTVSRARQRPFPLPATGDDPERTPGR